MGTTAHLEELRSLSDGELTVKLSESKEELFNLRFQLATGQLDDTSRFGQIKREIARVNTLLREREIAKAEELDKDGDDE